MKSIKDKGEKIDCNHDDSGDEYLLVNMPRSEEIKQWQPYSRFCYKCRQWIYEKII